jgi:HD superfamily phosphohydrolase
LHEEKQIKLASKVRIINDPVYGFISIPDELCFNLIEHSYFQRLRRIKQLGLTHLVYPGALHTRFHHSLGAMYLMKEALQVLHERGVEISETESQAVTMAILLHDLGHGPFSHSLESTIVKNITHEEFTGLFLHELNKEFDNALMLAISMFRNEYERKFFHQLLSGQLDMDRLDYLRRDSFYTGVSEGQIGSERIIKMLNVVEDNLVIEEKGRLSLEHFLLARRIMYWQVYFHKTVVAAETLLIKILERAKFLAAQGEKLFATPHFLRFLQQDFSYIDFQRDATLLRSFARIDDFDVFSSIKVWTEHFDPILSLLCSYLVDRRLFRVYFSDIPFDQTQLKFSRMKVEKDLGLKQGDGIWFVGMGEVSTKIYDQGAGPILIKSKQGKVEELTSMISSPYRYLPLQSEGKYFLCCPKTVELKLDFENQ